MGSAPSGIATSYWAAQDHGMSDVFKLRVLRAVYEETIMNIGKTLAVSAVSGILMGVLGGCGENKAAPDVKAPSTDVAPPAAKDCCKGKNECKGKSGCKAGDNASCAGKNECKGKGTACAK